MDSMDSGAVHTDEQFKIQGSEPDSTIPAMVVSQSSAFVPGRFDGTADECIGGGHGRDVGQGRRVQPGILLTNGSVCQQALAAALGQLVLEGTSNRRIRMTAGKMCGAQGTTDSIQQIIKRLDGVIDSWHTRSIGRVPVMYLGAMTAQVRRGTCLEPCTILLAAGIRDDGGRTALGAGVCEGPAQASWPDFWESLWKRGLNGLRLVISEEPRALARAMESLWPGAVWQRCQTKLREQAQEQAGSGAGSVSPLGKQIQWIWDSPDRPEAERRLGELADALAPTSPHLADWLKTHLPEGFPILDVPLRMRRRLRTTGLMADLMRRIRRQTRVAPFYPSCRALERVVCAVLMETCEDWEGGTSYLRLGNHHGHRL